MEGGGGGGGFSFSVIMPPTYGEGNELWLWDSHCQIKTRQ